MLDASKCYDRIIPSIATITMARLGAPINVGIAITNTLAHMEHRVRTASGISTQFIKQQSDTRWSGVGQGCAASGPIWLSMEAPMIQAYKRYTHGTHLSNPDRQITFEAQVTGYVDDTNTTLTYNNSVTQSELLHDEGKAMEGWSNLLTAIGGSLSETKSTVYIIIWEKKITNRY